MEFKVGDIVNIIGGDRFGRVQDGHMPYKISNDFPFEVREVDGDRMFLIGGIGGWVLRQRRYHPSDDWDIANLIQNRGYGYRQQFSYSVISTIGLSKQSKRNYLIEDIIKEDSEHK